MKKVNKKVETVLVEVYTSEIGAVGIYMDQHTKCADRGYKKIEAIDRLNAGISTCFSERDNGSRMLLEEILKDEEDHLDKLQIIYDHIKKYGDHYVVSHLI